ncbi:MAG: lysophospholipid acyltransferase family protein, partial [Bacteroidales bacterium]|nr:lysophospholipid acyltransferase family protein [Bacteroidales bacterium]
IDKNLRLSFPQKNEQELKEIKRKYYQHLTELAAEMIKMLTMSKKEVAKRYHCTNPELVNYYFEQGKSVVLMSSHYNNWEWMVLELDAMFQHHGIGVGAPNSNKNFEKLINRARTRYGTEVVFANKIRQVFEKNHAQHHLCSYMLLSDQSPSNVKKSYITTFLHHPTAVLFGAENFARKYDYPVIYYQVIKIKKGYYQIDCQLITESPNVIEIGTITKQYLQLLEGTILNQPEYWLWSHNRWKRKVE